MRVFLLILILLGCTYQRSVIGQTWKKQHAQIVISCFNNLSPDSISPTILSRKRYAKKIAKMVLVEKYGVLKAICQSPLMCANYCNYWVIWKFRPLKYRKGLGTLVIINAIDCRIEKTSIEK